MRILHSKYVFHEGRLDDLAIICGEDGYMEEVLSWHHLSEEEQTKAEYFEGILCPGFINTHCHLELSHMKGAISEKKGMAGFISEFITKRGTFSEEQARNPAAAAEQEMLLNGIVAVGDICNTDHTFGIKSENKLYYHSFIEVFDLHPSRAIESFGKGVELLVKCPGKASLVPHAPYTVSPELLRMLVEMYAGKKEPLCIHSQESEAENEFFSHKGPIWNLFTSLKMDLSWVPRHPDSSSYLSRHYSTAKLLRVHNTFVNRELLSGMRLTANDFFCTCPNANLYIENRLPDYGVWMESGLKITLGTDSYASNHSLSILGEMKTIRRHYPKISTTTLLGWATVNGAEFLGIGHTYGSFEATRKPGILHISGINNGEITEGSKVERLL